VKFAGRRKLQAPKVKDSINEQRNCGKKGVLAVRPSSRDAIGKRGGKKNILPWNVCALLRKVFNFPPKENRGDGRGTRGRLPQENLKKKIRNRGGGAISKKKKEGRHTGERGRLGLKADPGRLGMTKGKIPLKKPPAMQNNRNVLKGG